MAADINWKAEKTGLVVYQDAAFWLKLEAMQLDYKGQGIKITKAELAAKLMQIGYQTEVQELMKDMRI